MKEHYEDTYQSITSSIPMAPDLSDDSGEEDVPSDPQDKDYQPPSKHRKTHYRSTMSKDMLCAMDEVFALSMFMMGNTVQSLAAERQKEEELAEARSQEAGRLKPEGSGMG